MFLFCVYKWLLILITWLKTFSLSIFLQKLLLSRAHTIVMREGTVTHLLLVGQVTSILAFRQKLEQVSIPTPPLQFILQFNQLFLINHVCYICTPKIWILTSNIYV